MEKSTTTTTSRWKSTLITTGLLSILFFLYVPFFLEQSPYQWRHSTSRPKIESPKQIPAIYDSISQDPVESGDCAGHFGRDYIAKFSSSPIGFCSSRSSSSLTCFTHSVHAGRDDTFCIGSPVDMHAATETSAAGFTLDCSIPSVRQSSSSAALSLDKFPIYWFDTGPRTILEDHFHYGKLASTKETSPAFRHNAATNRTLILIKREGAVYDLWHTLLDVMALRLSLDVLSSSRDLRTGRPFLADADLPNAQLVLMDHFDLGPYADLWPSALTTATGARNRRPILRHEDLLPHEVAGSRVLLPLPGGSNPLWQGDWTDLPCASSALLRAFSQRLLISYNHQTQHQESSSLLNPAALLPRAQKFPPAAAPRLRITLIARQGSRRLAAHAAHLAALQARFPQHAIRSLDFHALTVAEQLRVIRHETDVLVGVHGAFLAHAMFLSAPGGSGAEAENTKHTATAATAAAAALVEIQPPSLRYRGFRNVARWAGVPYFLVEGREPEVRERGRERTTGAGAVEGSSAAAAPAANAAAFVAAGGAFTPSSPGDGGDGRDWRAAGEVEVEGRKLLEIVGRAIESVVAARGGGDALSSEEGSEQVKESI